MERLIRRVTRSPQVVAPPRAVADANAKVKAIDLIEDSLKSIAKLNRQIADAAAAIAAEEQLIEQQFKIAGVMQHSDGVLEAAMVDTYSNKKQEVDAKKLFNMKGFQRDHFFEVVKVQMGDLKKFLAENEINAISTTTPSKKTGTTLKITPVKPVVGTKPKRGK